jgi:hypothetical protein
MKPVVLLQQAMMAAQMFLRGSSPTTLTPAVHVSDCLANVFFLLFTQVWHQKPWVFSLCDFPQFPTIIPDDIGQLLLPETTSVIEKY